MLGFFKKQTIFTGTYWTKGDLRLKTFKVCAKSQKEAEKLLSKIEDFQFICEIRGGNEKL